MFLKMQNQTDEIRFTLSTVKGYVLVLARSAKVLGKEYSCFPRRTMSVKCLQCELRNAQLWAVTGTFQHLNRKGNIDFWEDFWNALVLRSNTSGRREIKHTGIMWIVQTAHAISGSATILGKHRLHLNCCSRETGLPGQAKVITSQLTFHRQ